jgi:uncharacterized protein DUF6498
MLNISINSSSQTSTRAGFKYLRNAKWDKSSTYLLFTNLLTIVVAYWQQWDINEVMWIYWAQSMLIGTFFFFKIWNLKNYSTQGFKINNRAVAATDITKIKTSIFFLIHYNIFHLAYFGFLAQNGLPKNLITFSILIISFAINHWQSYKINKKADVTKVENIGTIMFLPYLRIFPMHLTIIFGSLFSNISIIIFMLLKTGADLGMHFYEHRNQN